MIVPCPDNIPFAGGPAPSACVRSVCTNPPPSVGVFCSLVINFLINQGAYAPVSGARPMMKARPTGSRDALLCPQASRLVTVNRNPQTLTTLSPSVLLSNQGSTCPAPPSDVTPVSSQLTVPSLSNVNKNGRDRSSSTYKKKSC